MVYVEATYILDYEQDIKPHISVLGQSSRTDGTFSRANFIYDRWGEIYRRPGS